MSISHVNDSHHWYMNELTSQIVAESGIPTDRFHLGKIILHCFKEDPGFIHQIDGATGETETAGSMLKRSVQCAISLKKFGLKKGDVMVLMAPNHLDLTVPFYAAIYLGMIVAPVDRFLTVGEIHNMFNINRPKIIFCQQEKLSEVKAAVDQLNLEAKIVTFDKGSHDMEFSNLLEAEDKEIENFKPTEYSGDEIGFLVPTSGTTGLPKFAAIMYKTWTITGPYVWARFTKFPTPFSSAYIAAPLQWLSALVHFVVAPFIKYTKLQSSQPMTKEHGCHLINTYRPAFGALSTTMMVEFLKPEGVKCDISCFKMLFVGGSAVHKELFLNIQKAVPNTVLVNSFGMTELAGLAFQGPTSLAACGKPVGLYQYRLVNPETNIDIKGPNESGELWIKGPMFKEYYNDPKATADAFAEDKWLRTGDLFYRDEDWNYYFVERIKLMLKYKSYQVSPVEVESVISKHPGVLDVAVTSIPDPSCGDLLVACIVPRPGLQPTAQEIKDLVKDSLSDAKQLRGGVVFMKSLPTTASTKIHRRKLRDMVQTLRLE